MVCFLGRTGQGAIELACEPTAGTQLGQGATEYLVLLAVVLIVALVSVALLGFFPGMASDAQITQSQMYWKSATPISITESVVKTLALDPTFTYLYVRLRNSGAYPIRITAFVGADGNKATTFAGWDCGLSGYVNISDHYYLAPGEEKYFGSTTYFGTACNWQIHATTGASSTHFIGGASSLCQNSNTSPGILDYKSLGFEYIEYIDGQTITKRQIGKDFIVKCLPPY